MDIFDEVLDNSHEERKIYIMRWLLISLAVAGVLTLCVVCFFSWKTFHDEKITHQEVQKLDTLLANIDSIISNVEYKKLSKTQFIDSQYSLNNNLNAIKQLFLSGTSIASTRAGFFLVNIAYSQKDYTTATYYLQQLIDNYKLDSTLRDYAKWLLVQIKLVYAKKDKAVDIDSYFTPPPKVSSSFILHNDPHILVAHFRFLHGILELEQKKYREAHIDLAAVGDVINSYNKAENSHYTVNESMENRQGSIMLMMAKENMLYATQMQNAAQ